MNIVSDTKGRKISMLISVGCMIFGATRKIILIKSHLLAESMTLLLFWWYHRSWAVLEGMRQFRCLIFFFRTFAMIKLGSSA